MYVASFYLPAALGGKNRNLEVWKLEKLEKLKKQIKIGNRS